MPVQHPAEPPQTATPLVKCGAGSQPASRDIPDGRVPSGSDPNGLWCNMKLIGHQGTSGGFKTLRYIDDAGHECAFYDTALLFPTNAVNFAGPSLGVAVLDMSDPAHPVQTDTLTELPMMSPHESLALNPKRGLLAAVNGNPTTYPGPRLDLRRPPGLPPPGPAVDLAGGALRPRVGLRARRQDVLRDRHGREVRDRDRRDRSRRRRTRSGRARSWSTA